MPSRKKDAQGRLSFARCVQFGCDLVTTSVFSAPGMSIRVQAGCGFSRARARLYKAINYFSAQSQIGFKTPLQQPGKSRGGMHSFAAYWKLKAKAPGPNRGMVVSSVVSHRGSIFIFIHGAGEIRSQEEKDIRGVIGR